MAHEYGKLEFWEEHYQKNKQPLDLIYRWASPNQVYTLRDAVYMQLKPEYNILIVGCGSSRLAEELADDGFTNTVSIDWSYNAIRAMEEIYSE